MVKVHVAMLALAAMAAPLAMPPAALAAAPMARQPASRPSPRLTVAELRARYQRPPAAAT